jgi:hypothetical protein
MICGDIGLILVSGKIEEQGELYIVVLCYVVGLLLCVVYFFFIIIIICLPLVVGTFSIR